MGFKGLNRYIDRKREGFRVGVVARISPCYRGRNGSLLPIGQKGRFLLMVNAEK